MSNTLSLLSHIRRPGLLIRAARHGLADYQRQRDIARLIGTDPSTSTEAILNELMKVEAEIEAHRRAGVAVYSISKHIAVLVALMAEARFATVEAARR